MTLALHFVGFNDPMRYDRARRVFGDPDFVHRAWDVRAAQELAPGDVAVFATTDAPRDWHPPLVLTMRYDPDAAPSPHSWDDSAEPDDPATLERR